MPELWCPFAIRLDGPPEKTGYSGAQKTHAKVGVTLHSMEYESTPEWNDATTLYNALFSEREASWPFSIVKFFDGALLFQHYPIGAVCWAQGYQGNLWLDSIEHEGIAPGKFTEPQFALLVKTLRWIKEAHGWPGWVPTLGDRRVSFENWQGLGANLFEHNAVPGAPPTHCAVFRNGQLDPIRLLAELQQEEDDMGLKRELEIAREFESMSGELFMVEAAQREWWAVAGGDPVAEAAAFGDFCDRWDAFRAKRIDWRRADAIE